VKPDLVNQGPFGMLQADSIAGRFKLIWSEAPGDLEGAPEAVVSTGTPEQWEQRDWVSYPMKKRGSEWEALIPVDHPDVPLVYFVGVFSSPRTSVTLKAGPVPESQPPLLASPLRRCQPRALGVQAPTRVFWPVLDGFEDHVQEWQWTVEKNQATRLALSEQSHRGHFALQLELPQDHGRAVVGTTRLKGWQIEQQKALGLRLWLRTFEGQGQVKVVLVSHAFTDREKKVEWIHDPPLTAAWQAVDVPFAAFPNMVTDRVTYLLLELSGDPGEKFLLDDLQLLGPWPSL
jgi:hypothetical protein